MSQRLSTNSAHATLSIQRLHTFSVDATCGGLGGEGKAGVGKAGGVLWASQGDRVDKGRCSEFAC